MSNKTPVLSCHNLSKTFTDADQTVSVLQAVDLSVYEGETVAIVGSSGSGKTTLLQLLGGLDKPTTGELRWNDRLIADLSDAECCALRNRFLGFVYQFHHLLPEFSVLENAAMPLWIAGVSSSEATQRAAEVLKKAGLAHRLTHRVGEISGGERQRVAIARALVTQPAVVLADEPTGNLDVKTAEQVTDLMLELNESTQTSFVIVTHNMQLASRLGRQFRMDAGRLLLET